MCYCFHFEEDAHLKFLKMSRGSRPDLWTISTKKGNFMQVKMRLRCKLWLIFTSNNSRIKVTNWTNTLKDNGVIWWHTCRCPGSFCTASIIDVLTMLSLVCLGEESHGFCIWTVISWPLYIVYFFFLFWSRLEEGLGPSLCHCGANTPSSLWTMWHDVYSIGHIDLYLSTACLKTLSSCSGRFLCCVVEVFYHITF